MLQSVNLSQINAGYVQNKINNSDKKPVRSETNPINQSAASSAALNLYTVNTSLNKTDSEKYLYLLNFLKNIPPSKNSEGLTAPQQLDFLLKNGKLLAKSNDDKSTTLDNLYDIATIERTANLDSKRVISDTLDILVNPRYVTQRFGDIPVDEARNVLSHQKADSQLNQNPNLMNVSASGVCPAASLEVNAAHRYPADYVRWISKLSSKDRALFLNTKLKSISKDPIEAAQILKIFDTKNSNFNFNKSNKLKLTLDDNAYIRANLQQNYWDEGERNIADVIFQSAVMNFATQNTYDSLTDWRAPNFNSNTQGLVEVEKTFVESVFKNREITSLVYQKIDDDQNLLGYTCSFDKIARHITDTIDSGDDVIIGYVLTNETAGITSNPDYNKDIHGAPNKVINGHEITIIDYIRDTSGRINFVCVDTDDDSHDFVIYSSDWLLPKIHHAGYPAEIVKDDEKEIMKQLEL